jgi:glycosyltransferase involved in cell wall biosynthesis
LRICTIIARNYLGQAEVLAESFREHHPNGAVSVLIVDDRERLVEGRPGLYDVVRPEDLPIPRFEGMAAMYDITELCTAVKPWLLRHLLDAGEPVAYFDPDICFYAGVDELVDLAREHQVVLIPHITSPFPEDGQTPNDAFVLAAGAYNLGFIALGPGEAGAGLLDWWSARLRFDCVNDVGNGYFVDQRWFDLVPGMFPRTAVVRDPGMNVAYWNLHERDVRVDADGRRLVGDAPLKFFHFSGFDPRVPDELSRYQSRFRLRDVPVVAALCRDYAQRVVSRAARFGPTEWPFDRLADGRPFDRALRRLYRQGERAGAFELSPFTVGGTHEFIAWLAEVAPDAPGDGINRYWTYVYRARPDLQAAFPALAGPDGERYLHWVVNHGAAEVESSGLLPPQPEPEVPPTHDQPAPGAPAGDDGAVWGVNVGGYLESEVGVGEAARAAISALDAARIPVLPVHGPWRPNGGQGHRFTTFRPEDAVFPVNLLCVNADMTAHWLAEAGPGFRAGRYTIGLWWWEVTTWPEQWLGAFDHVDEVWVATDHIHAALAPVATVPVTKITLPVRAPVPRQRSRADLGLPDGFLFFFMFDYWSVVERKNPFDTIEAFIDAFEPGEGARLAIKCINQDANRAAHERLRLLAARHPDVQIVEGYVSAADKNSMIASADCYVSLHRSEGYGLTLAESLLFGKPVIATRYGGNLDFMSPDGSWLVDAEMVPIGAGKDPYPAEGEWAQPDVAQASRYMREIFDDPAAARERAARGAERIRRTHSPRAAGATMAARLELLRSRRSEWPAHRQLPAAPRHEPAEIEAVAALLSRGPVSARVNPSAARSALRQSALRVMAPYTVFEQQVDRALLDAVRALRALDDEIESRLESRLGKQVALVTAAVREVEFAVAELSAQVSASSDATAEWLEALPESHRGLERHFSALEADVAARLGELTDRLSQAEVRLRQLEAPALVSDRARFASLAALHRAHMEVGAGPPAASRTDGLDGYELRGFSQNGEDGVLAEILTRIGAENRFFVEFGIESGREGTCVYLADVAGWNGLFIEADPDMHRGLSDRYAANDRVQTVHALVTPANVEQLFADAGVPESLDVLSIDVDGSDYWIWDALHAYRPRVVVIEYNSALPADARLAQPRDHGRWEGTDFQGASLGAMVRLGTQKGYRLVHTETSGVNAFFVRNELAGARFPAPESIPKRKPNYFQIGYRHPPDTNGRRYIDLDTGELVRPPTNGV